MPSYPFASTTIKAKELSILSEDKVQKLLALESAQDVVNTLIESGYGKREIDSPLEYEKLIYAENMATYEFIKKTSPCEQLSNLFFYRFDYHNLKVILKSHITDSGLNQRTLINAGVFEYKVLSDAIADKNYAYLTMTMRESLNAIDKAFAMKQDVSIIDIILDKGYAREVSLQLQEITDETPKKYFAGHFDFTNIIMMLRLKDSGCSKESFLKAMLPGGTISQATLSAAFDMAPEEQKPLLARGSYATYLNIAYDEYIAYRLVYMFEEQRANYLREVVFRSGGDIFSFGPVMHYLIQKERESAVIRTIMIGKLNSMPNEYIENMMYEV